MKRYSKNYLTHTLFVLFCGSLITSCSYLPGQAPEEPVRLLKATQRRYIGGVPGSGITTSYCFTAIQQTRREAVPDTVWVRNRPFALKLKYPADTKSGKPDEDHRFRSGDTLYFCARKFDPSRKLRRKQQEPGMTDSLYHLLKAKEQARFDKMRPPVQYEGAALIRFRIKGEVRYLTVKKLERLPDVVYP